MRVGGLSTLVLVLGWGITAAPAAEKPNVVFILADDLGWTDLGCQGSKYYETPNIDRLARAGLRFTSASTCGPNCQPTRAALVSGRYGPRTGVYTVGAYRPLRHLAAAPLFRSRTCSNCRRPSGRWARR